MHQNVKELTDRKNEIKSGSSCIKDKNGDMLFEKDQVAERWVEYISELYADDNRPEKEIITEIEGPEILQSEVENAIKKLKSGKAPGIDEIRGEELKALDSTGIQIITELCNEIYNNGYVPRDLRHSLYIKIPKKSKTTECTEHRTISLMSHAIKVILQIIIQRNSNKIEREIGKTQSGFRPKKGTREGIFNLRMIFDKYTELDKNIYICFIDYEKAVHRVYHHKLMDTLKRINIDGKDMRVIQALYYDQVAAVRIEDGHSEEFKIKRGVRQGCILSLKLFNLYTENVFREIDNLDGVKIGGININNLRYADDTALLAESEEQLQRMVNEVNSKSEDYGLRMNVKKTKVMVVRRSQEETICNIFINGKKLEQVKSFKYLGQQITEDGKCEQEIRSRIEIARGNFIKMKDVFTSKKLKLTTRKCLLKCYVLSTLLYASETWTISGGMEDKINAFEMWLYRRMLKVSYQDHVTNEEILQRIQERPKLLTEMKRRKMLYLGHIIRGNEIQRDILGGMVEGTRKRGRPRISWFGDIVKWTGKTRVELMRAAQDRDKWRTMAAQVNKDNGTR